MYWRHLILKEDILIKDDWKIIKNTYHYPLVFLFSIKNGTYFLLQAFLIHLIISYPFDKCKFFSFLLKSFFYEHFRLIIILFFVLFNIPTARFCLLEFFYFLTLIFAETFEKMLWVSDVAKLQSNRPSKASKYIQKVLVKYLTHVVNKMLVFINCLPKVFSKTVAKYY